MQDLTPGTHADGAVSMRRLIVPPATQAHDRNCPGATIFNATTLVSFGPFPATVVRLERCAYDGWRSTSMSFSASSSPEGRGGVSGTVLGGSGTGASPRRPLRRAPRRRATWARRRPARPSPESRTAAAARLPARSTRLDPGYDGRPPDAPGPWPKPRLALS
jgi:hypothetical protein